MAPIIGSESVPRGHGAAGFVVAALRAINWRWLLAAQAVASLLALTIWLTSGSDATPALFMHLLCAQGLSAFLVLLAAPTADESMRHGWSVLRAFVVAILGVSIVNAAAQWALHLAFKDIGDTPRLVVIVNDFFNVTGNWSIVLLVYLNRQSAARLLARLRQDDLTRVEAERLAITARLQEIEARMDSTEVLRQLSAIRLRYARGDAAAEAGLENLILTLQRNVALARSPAEEARTQSAICP